MYLENSRKRIEDRYRELCREFPDFFGEISRKIQEREEREALALKWMYGTMPWSDRGNYPFDTFLDFAVHGVRLWEEKEEVRRLPEEIYLNYVLCHRVNEEEIRPCRTLFYEKMKEQIGEKTGTKAAVEVNYWCASQATYQSTDDRTLSALAVFERGNGRCGEESVFAVNAMRSAGIPARQVYAPKWSHCDDNHAWVEIWENGVWYFTGACEPLPVLNKGWFTDASSRAMMVHARWFDTALPRGEEVIGKEGMVTMLNELGRYARVQKLRVVIEEADGTPAAGANVQFEVLNYAQYAPAAEMTADQNGEAVLTTGAGTLHISAEKEGRTGEAFFDGQTQKNCRIVLKTGWSEHGWTDCDFTAPKDAPVNTVQMTKLQKEQGEEKLGRAEAARLKKTEGWENPEWVRFCRYLETLDEEKAACGRKLLGTLTAKDRTDCRFEVLKSHLEGAFPYCDMTDEESFVTYVLNPRVEDEVMTAWRAPLEKWVGAEKEAYRKDPRLLWNRIQREVRALPDQERSTLITVPEACIRTGIAGERSQKVLFVAAARSIGIPARLNPDDGAAEYREGVDFVRLIPGEERTCRLILESGDDTEWNCFQNWSLARWEGRKWRSVRLSGRKWENRRLELSVGAGSYRLITSNRLPNGNQFARQCMFVLKEGEERRIEMKLRTADLSDMLENLELPEFYVKDANGRERSATELTKGGFRVMIWLEEGREPTEHILNEMLEEKERFRGEMNRITFVVRSGKALDDPTIKKALEAFPDITVFYDDFRENVTMLGRRMYVDHEKLPLILVTDGERNGVYAASGYNVGTGAMLLRILALRSRGQGVG